MKNSKEILGRIFAIWASLIFLITMFPSFLLIWMAGVMKEPGRTEAFRKISYVWMKIFFFLSGCRLKITGLANFKKGRNYIVVSNHNSYMDVPLLTPFIPGPNKTIAKIEMSRIPLFGLIYKRGSILVDRTDKDSRRGSYNKMRDVLSNGMHMCIYPEGTRNKTSQPLKEFQDGAFRLAIETRKPVIAAVLFDTRKVLPADKGFYFMPSKMEVHFLPARYITEADTAEDLKQEIFEKIKQELVTH